MHRSPPRRSCRCPARATAALVLAACTATPAWSSELVQDATAAVAHDSNVSRAELRDDIRADDYVEAQAGALWRISAGDADDATLELRLAARGARYRRHPGLSYAAADGEIGYWRKLGLGLEAPWMRASVRGAREDFAEDTRDSALLDLRLEAGRRFSARLDGAIGYLYDRRFARHVDVLVPGISGAVWDVAGHTGYVRAGYAVSDRLQLDGGYARRRGDVVATTQRNLTIFRASEAIGATDAFGAGFFDYRLRGTSHIANAAASYALDERSSLNLGYAYAFTRAAQGLQYQNHVVNASWVSRW